MPIGGNGEPEKRLKDVDLRTLRACFLMNGVERGTLVLILPEKRGERGGRSKDRLLCRKTGVENLRLEVQRKGGKHRGRGAGKEKPGSPTLSSRGFFRGSQALTSSVPQDKMVKPGEKNLSV